MPARSPSGDDRRPAPDGPDPDDLDAIDAIDERDEREDAAIDADAPPPPPPAARPRPVVPDEGVGSSIIVTSWVGTAVYTVLAIATLASVSTFQAALLVVCSVLFLVGFGAGFLAYAIAISRSREEAIGMGGLFFLAGSAPRRVQVHLLTSFAVEVVVALATASLGFAVVPADANNVLAVGVLTPLYGLGLAGLWGARHGRFGPRAVEESPRAARRRRLALDEDDALREDDRAPDGTATGGAEDGRPARTTEAPGSTG